jgi:hypothetical protein
MLACWMDILYLFPIILVLAFVHVDCILFVEMNVYCEYLQCFVWYPRMCIWLSVTPFLKPVVQVFA